MKSIHIQWFCQEHLQIDHPASCAQKIWKNYRKDPGAEDQVFLRMNKNNGLSHRQTFSSDLLLMTLRPSILTT